MSDHITRAQTRRTHDGDQYEQAKHLAGLLHAKAKVPMPVRNAPPLNIVVPKRKHCLLHAWEDRPADALPVLRLRAYAGDEAAREVLGDLPVPGDSGNCVLNYDYFDDCDNTTTWLGRLTGYAEALPPVAVSGVECECAYKTCMGCHDSRNGRQCSKCGGTERIKRRRPLKKCCNGTGIRTVTTKAPRYLAVCIGLAVGRVVWQENYAPLMRSSAALGGVVVESLRALDACERWAWCPCPANAEAWRQAWVLADDDAQGPVWVPSPRPTIARIQAIVETAARRVSPEAIHEAARLMVLEVMGELG